MNKLLSLKTVDNRLTLIQVWMSHLTLSITVLSLALQVLARQLDWDVDWTEELARFSFLVMVFASATYASSQLSHLKVTVFSDLISRWKPGAWVLVRIQFILVVTFDGLFFWYALSNVIEGLRYPTISPALLFNENLLFIAPVSFFFIAIIQRFLRVFIAPNETLQGLSI